MPPRIPILTCLGAPKPSQFTLPFRPFSSTPFLAAKSASRPKKRVSHDPYIVAQRNRKKAANISKRAGLEEARVASLGDPVHGIATPFVESLSAGLPVQHEESKEIPKDQRHLNYALRPNAVERQLKKSEELAVPLEEKNAAQEPLPGQYVWSEYSKFSSPARTAEDVQKQAEELEKKRENGHARATEAIARITALGNGSSKDRMRVNIARCVATFGRHNTDCILPPRAPPLPSINSSEPHPIRPKTNIVATEKRIGPDTGSSEVQIAILTAKIKTLADFLATRGKGDKHNKRNLRLLVHRRQKLLQYLRRKERGGPRWQHTIETLGLTEGTWKGEISL